MKTPPIPGGACDECWSGYFGDVHSDWCSKSTAKTCVVCQRKYHQGRGDGRCLVDDYAHTKGFTTPTNQEAA